MIATPPAVFGTIDDAVLHVGTPALRAATDDFVGRAGQSLHVDLFRVDDRPIIDRLVAVSDDVRLSVLADTDVATGRTAEALRRRAGTGWTELGGDPLKQHGKSASRDDGAEAIVATDLADADASRRVELGITFGGAPARGLAALHAAGHGRADGLADALDATAALGVLANDPRTGARFATQGIELLVDRHGGRLRVMTKAFDDEDLAERFAAAVRGAELDVPAELLTHDLPKRQEKVLERAGIILHEIDEKDAERAGIALHGTLIDTNRGVLLGSPYLEERVLNGSGGRRSREVAVLLGGDAATQARDAWTRLRDASLDL